MNFVNYVCTGLKDGFDPGISELPKETYVCKKKIHLRVNNHLTLTI